MIFIKLLPHRPVREIIKEYLERKSAHVGASLEFRIHPDFLPLCAKPAKEHWDLMEDVTTGNVLWEHQKQAIAKLRKCESGNYEKRGFALFMSPGTGKTRIMVEQIRHLFNIARKHRNTLIVCPPIVVKQWRDEILKYSKIPPQTVVCLRGPGKQRLEMFLHEISEQGRGRIFITNYESLLMTDLFNAFVGWVPEVLILDESHRIKNHSAKRTKQALRLGKLASYRYIMTGSPILNSIEDIYPQISFINEKIFPKNFFAFRHTYMWDANRNMPKHKYFPNWKPRPEAEKAINFLIEPISFKAKKEDCLTLPPFIRQRIEVEMSPEQERAYKQMKNEFITFIKESAVVAELAITKTLRMRQILSGFAKSDDDKNHQFMGNPRITALGELIEDLAPSEKIIVWCEFRENYNQVAGIVTKLGFNFKLLVGDQSQKEKDEAVHAFRTDPSVRVLISNPGAGGIGVNLVEASHMIYFSRSPSLEHDIQSEARAYRGGSEIHQKITRWDLVCPGTLDDVILEALKNKQAIGDAIVGWAQGQERTGRQEKR